VRHWAPAKRSAIVLIDIARFTLINDTSATTAGDETDAAGGTALRQGLEAWE